MFGSTSKSEESSGFLREASLVTLWTLFVHAVSDSAEVQDVPGRWNEHEAVGAVLELLGSLLFNRCLHWNQWVKVAVRTGSGTIWSRLNLSDREAPAGATAALQYGSCVFARAWLALDRELKTSEALRVMVMEGNIKGPPDNIGIVQCEGDSVTLSEYDDVPEPLSSPVVLLPESMKVELFTEILRVEDSMYSLVTTMIPGDRLRIVSPADSIMVYLCAKGVHCNHDASSPLRPASAKVQIDNIDLALKDNCGSRPSRETLMFFTIVDSHLKECTSWSYGLRYHHSGYEY